MLGIHVFWHLYLKNYAGLIRGFVETPLVFALVQLSYFAFFVVDFGWSLLPFFVEFIVFFEN